MCDKQIEQYFPVVLFIILCNLVHTFAPVNKILKCELNALSCGAVPIQFFPN